jgi:nucleoid-associated protein YgaU
MFRAILFFIVILLSGCTTRTFVAEQKSADTLAAHPEGNRGYLMGKPPQDLPEAQPRHVPTLEIELGSRNPTLEKRIPAEPYSAPASSADLSVLPSHDEAVVPVDKPAAEPLFSSKEYTVQSGDTLQKISQKLYGTTKKWHKLYLLNKDIMKSPDKIHPGMVIKVIDKEQP